MTATVRIEYDSRPGVATLRLDRPKVNAIDESMIDQIQAAADELSSHDATRAVVVWGGPKVFAAGADITRFPDFDAPTAREFSERINRAFLAVENLPQITIAAVNGYALGGGMELSMSTDFRFAADDAIFGQPEILLGLIPGGGGTQRLTRLVGVTRAKELIYGGGQLDASEALNIGLVSAVHPSEGLYDAALEAAARHAAGPAALRMAKRSIMDGLHLSLADAVKREADHFAECFTTADSTVGVASFLENGPGKATFTGQ